VEKPIKPPRACGVSQRHASRRRLPLNRLPRWNLEHKSFLRLILNPPDGTEDEVGNHGWTRINTKVENELVNLREIRALLPLLIRVRRWPSVVGLLFPGRFWLERFRSITCHSAAANLQCARFWKGGESLLAQAGGGKSELHRARCRVTWSLRIGIHAGGTAERLSDGKCHRKQNRR